MALICRLAPYPRQLAYSCHSQIILRKMITTSNKLVAMQKYSADDWEKKNERMGRPLSPHLSIYKFQLTSMLSITHRAMGMCLHFGLLGFAGAVVLLPNSYPHYLGLLASTGAGQVALMGIKFIISWPFFFHTLNGIRHLAWDMGKGFSIKTVYKSGYAVVALSVLAAIGASMM